jgi:hypothetical protein
MAETEMRGGTYDGTGNRVDGATDDGKTPPGLVDGSMFQFVHSVKFDGNMMYREKPEGPGDKTYCQKMGCAKQETEERWYQNESASIGFDTNPGSCCGPAPYPEALLDGSKVGALFDVEESAKCCSDAEVPVLTLKKGDKPHYAIKVFKEAQCGWLICSEMWCDKNCSCKACLGCDSCFDCYFCCADCRCCSCLCGGCPYCLCNLSICCGKPCFISPVCLCHGCHGCTKQSAECCTGCCTAEDKTVRDWRILSQPIYAAGEGGAVVGSIDSLWYKKTKQSVTCNVPGATREEQAMLMLIPWYMRDRKAEEINFMKGYTPKQLKQTETLQTFFEALKSLGISA